jgi:hypothetical protein
MHISVTKDCKKLWCTILWYLGCMPLWMREKLGNSNLECDRQSQQLRRCYWVQMEMCWTFMWGWHCNIRNPYDINEKPENAEGLCPNGPTQPDTGSVVTSRGKCKIALGSLCMWGWSLSLSVYNSDEWDVGPFIWIWIEETIEWMILPRITVSVDRNWANWRSCCVLPAIMRAFFWYMLSLFELW